jgi:hypothetical protein
MTDLHALISERCAAKIAEGKRPSKADLEWLEATREQSQPYSHVEKSRNAKGETQLAVKVYGRDPLEAAALSDAIYDRQRARYPMLDGTVGSPVIDNA